MTQYDFDKLLEKYLRGACSPEEELLLNEWSEQQLNSTTEQAEDQLIPASKKLVWKRLQQSTRPAERSIIWFSWPKLSIAAAVVLAVCASLWWPKREPLQTQVAGSNPSGIQMSNHSNSPQDITLKDGSIVTLQPQSSLTLNEKFGLKDRKVHLKGEAFFKVARMEDKPFYVYAGKLVTKVLGTSFRVRSYAEDQQTEVSVVSGKVKVYAPQKSAFLTPNQKVIYDKNTQQLNATVVDQPQCINPPSTAAQFVFEETPLLKVLEEIQKSYGLEIAAEATLANCTFSGDLNGLDLYLQLDLICKSINAQVEKRETSLLIKGEGCE